MLRIETETERATIVDIFDIIQTVRNTCIHLRVDVEQWRIARGNARGKRVGLGPSRTTCQGYGTQQVILIHTT